MGQCHHKGDKSNKRRLTSLDLKGKVVGLGDGWQVIERQINSLPGLFAVKII